MRRRFTLPAVIVCLAALAVWAGLWARQSPSPVARLATAREILQLSPEAAERQVPVLLSDAIVTSFDPEVRLSFVQDQTGGVYLDSMTAPVPLRVGDRVRVLADARYRVLAAGPAPPAVPISTAQALAGPVRCRARADRGRASQPVDQARATRRDGADHRGSAHDVSRGRAPRRDL